MVNGVVGWLMGWLGGCFWWLGGEGGVVDGVVGWLSG